MKIGVQDIRNVIYDHWKRAGYKGGLRPGQFAQDTAEEIYEMILQAVGDIDVKNKQWDLAHDFPAHLSKVVDRLEKGLGFHLLRTPEAQQVYEFILAEDNKGNKIETFTTWATQPERTQYKPKYYSKPEYLRVDYLQAFTNARVTSESRTALLETITDDSES